ncbi:hypothetical protein [Conyzicola sp.]|uniref:hypothetical protein n=1 Tax=Conyzicola sp. TaxID=1969404 RepID=UPI003989D914
MDRITARAREFNPGLLDLDVVEAEGYALSTIATGANFSHPDGDCETAVLWNADGDVTVVGQHKTAESALIGHDLWRTHFARSGRVED